MINISKETHPELYLDYKKCVEFCSNIPSTTYNNHVDFHMLWKTIIPFGRKQTLPIKSFITTQNLNNCTLNLWSNVDLSHNEYLKPLLPYVKLRRWDAIKESKDTPLEKHIDKLNLSDDFCWVDGDLFRALCLYKYGGLYHDTDVIFLRDLAPLFNQEFMYTWGLETELISGGMIRLFKESQLGLDILNEISQTQPRIKSADWSAYIVYPRVRTYNKNWTIFPSVFFNTEWHIPNNEVPEDMQALIDSPNPMHLCKHSFSNQLYEGVFSWHWHNGWTFEAEEGSKWQILENKVNKNVIEQLGIYPI